MTSRESTYQEIPPERGWDEQVAGQLSGKASTSNPLLNRTLLRRPVTSNVEVEPQALLRATGLDRSVRNVVQRFVSVSASRFESWCWDPHRCAERLARLILRAELVFDAQKPAPLFADGAAVGGGAA